MKIPVCAMRYHMHESLTVKNEFCFHIFADCNHVEEKEGKPL